MGANPKRFEERELAIGMEEQLLVRTMKRVAMERIFAHVILARQSSRQRASVAPATSLTIRKLSQERCLASLRSRGIAGLRLEGKSITDPAQAAYL